jgi:hypothetical protein
MRQWVDEPPREQDLLVFGSRLNAGLMRAAFVTLRSSANFGYLVCDHME